MQRTTVVAPGRTPVTGVRIEPETSGQTTIRPGTSGTFSMANSIASCSASVIADGAFYHLDAPVKRMGAMDVPVPFSPVLEDLTVPSEKTVFEAARALCGR